MLVVGTIARPPPPGLSESAKPLRQKFTSQAGGDAFTLGGEVLTPRSLLPNSGNAGVPVHRVAKQWISDLCSLEAGGEANEVADQRLNRRPKRERPLGGHAAP